MKGEWQPIETAPKDTGNKIEYILIAEIGILPDLVVWNGRIPPRVVSGTLHHERPEGWFNCGGSRSRLRNPTHWMPLPEPPK